MLNEVMKEVEKGSVKESKEGELSLFKYSQQCVFDDMWNDINKKCRGIIFNNQTGEIVARPYNKFFNLNERPETSYENVMKNLGQKFSITEKLDGSCIAIWYDGKVWRASTPGSMSSEQAKYAESIFPRYNFSEISQNHTYMCELISPWNRVVIDYGERDELILITAFTNEWEPKEVNRGFLDYVSDTTGLKKVKTINSDDIGAFLLSNVPDGEEGYVIRFSNGERIKLKGSWYFNLHNLIGNLSIKNMVEMVSEGNYHEVVKDLPDYIKDDFDDIYSQVITTKDKIDKEVCETWEKALREIKDVSNFKACAQLFSKHDTSAILFVMMRDKLDLIDSLTWKLVLKRLSE